MKFFLQDDTSVQVDEILRSLNKLMDGDVSGQMKEKGLQYHKNYGASIVWLRKLAIKYQGNNELADRLWHREIRETMILATLIAVPDDSLFLKVEEWVMNSIQNEIAEQLGANLLYRMPAITQWSVTWLTSENEWKQAAAWVALASYLQRGGSLIINDVGLFMELLLEEKGNISGFMMRVQGRFLRQLCRKSADLLNVVRDLIQQIKTQSARAWLVEDVQTEIDFLKE